MCCLEMVRKAPTVHAVVGIGVVGGHELVSDGSLAAPRGPDQLNLVIRGRGLISLNWRCEA